jgi:hypothetical protein
VRRTKAEPKSGVVAGLRLLLFFGALQPSEIVGLPSFLVEAKKGVGFGEFLD